jgi:hypothetical protein
MDRNTKIILFSILGVVLFLMLTGLLWFVLLVLSLKHG